MGLEPTPERHVERMVDVFREVKRVLRDDGVVFLNYGDCYGHGTEARRPSGNTRGISDKTSDAQNINRHGGTAGNLMMMPHRVALALQADSWIVRQDLVWSKSNPMPESVNGWRWQSASCDCGKAAVEKRIAAKMEETGLDRAHVPGRDFTTIPDPECPKCSGSGKVGDLELKRGSWRHTRAHEYVFMLTKKMQYFSNQEAVREASDPKQEAHNRRFAKNYDNLDRIDGGQPGNVNNAGIHERPGPGGRNPRSVLDVPTAPYKGSHYATFPPNLIAPLIRATCPRWACPVCGQGWAAVVDRTDKRHWTERNEYTKSKYQLGNNPSGRNDGRATFASPDFQHFGYRLTCEHPHTQEEAVPGIVLDPFVGSGTTIAVAKELLRRGVGIDISMEYLDQQAKVRAGLGTPSNALDDLPLFK